jgi:serine protease AprX
MDLSLLSLRTTRWLGSTRWGVAAVAVAAAATCVPSSPAQVGIGAGVWARPSAVVVGTTSAFDGGRWGDPTADAVSKDSYGKNQAAKDPGSLYTVERAIGARGLWGKKDKSERNLTGQGVGVAVLDSGVAAVAGLGDAGKVTYGPDLSIEANGVLAQQDSFGHGTFMAGIIAGRGELILLRICPRRRLMCSWAWRRTRNCSR